MRIPSHNGRWRFQEVPDEQLMRPDDWGSDPLTEFLEATHKNTYLMVNAHKAAVKRVRAGFELFHLGAEAYSQARRKYSANDDYYALSDFTLPFLLATAQSLYAAATLAFSGQQTEAAKPLRGAIETALYSYHLHRDAEAVGIWASRPLAAALRNVTGAEEARKQRRKAGAEFSVPRIINDLRKEDAKLAALALDLYEQMIDDGGHFNMLAFRAHARFSRLPNPDRRRVDYRTIGATAPERRNALRALLSVTSCVLRILQTIYHESWESSGVSERLLAFTKSID